MYICLKILTKLEAVLRDIREKIIRKKYNAFLKKHGLIEGVEVAKTNNHYNPYEGTNTIMLDKLISTGLLKKDDKILDIGCGVGVFMIYLASKGFRSIKGYELDNTLFSLCEKNIDKYKKFDKYVDIGVIRCNATLFAMDDLVNVFYLYNPFYDRESYSEWLDRVYESILRNKRQIKIVILYPTISCRIALDECSWLKKIFRIICEEQPCSRCINFLVYESNNINQGSIVPLSKSDLDNNFGYQLYDN